MDTIPQDTPQKQCSQPDCRQWFPATAEFFRRSKTTKDGLLNQCRACYSKKRRVRDSRPKNREQHNAYLKDYHRRPAAREQERKRTRHPKHAAYMKAYCSQPQYRNRKKGYAKTYRSRPGVRERMRASDRIRWARHRARKRAVLGTHTTQQIQDLLKRQKHHCYYCSTKFEKKDGKYVYHVEHTFPLSRVVGTDIPANDISYLVLACPTCNLKKGNKYPWEFYEGGRLF